MVTSTPPLKAGAAYSRQGGVEFTTERIAGFFVKSSVLVEGETYTRTISILGNVTKEKGLFELVKTFEAEAKAEGATTVILKGVTVENKDLFNPTIAQRLGYTFKQLSDKSFELVKTLTK